MKKSIILVVIMSMLSVVSFSYEDFYEKVYTMKLSKKELFKIINATENQQKKLSKIFDNYQNKAKNVNKKLEIFSEKREKLGKVESERYEEIAKVLNYEQLLAFNNYIIENKLKFEEKNDKIKNMMDNLNLSTEQESKILKFDREFERKVEKMRGQNLIENTFFSKYYEFRRERDEKIKEVLSEKQLKIAESVNF